MVEDKSVTGIITGFAYFERTPDGKVHSRPFNGIPIKGSKLLSIGKGSEPSVLKNAIENSIT
ncbi:hypothetical protein [Polaribacter sp. KT25b]|uniref:hypothetical protein n=1 Tax=Polaribacter sp. KT25b TaxID=1855336 RepID=UPI000B89A071|nr:hypothetical protein [Polaribacter sp. KT25b]